LCAGTLKLKLSRATLIAERSLTRGKLRMRLLLIMMSTFLSEKSSD